MGIVSPSLWSQPHKTHKVNFVKVYYRWHPLYNQEIQIINKFNRGGECFYLIKLSDSSCTLLPFWMTDESFCQRFVLKESGYCSIQALDELRQLLDTLDK